MANSFERTQKPKFSSIPWLVEALQRIHDQRVSRSEGYDSSRRSAIEQEHQGLVDLVLGSVASETWDFGKRLRSAPDPDISVRANGSLGYRGLREELDRVEATARRHATFVERAIAQTAPGRSSSGASFYQETLYLRCRRLGRSGGRFRCENFRGRRTEVRVFSRSFTAGAADLLAQPGMVLRPDDFVLGAGESRVVAVEIDLSACTDLAIGTLQTSIDLLMDDAVALKLWLEVDVYDLP